MVAFAHEGPQPFHFHSEAAHLQGFLQTVQEIFGFERFGHEVVGPLFGGFDGSGDGPVGSQDDHGEVGLNQEQLLQQHHAVHFLHF